MNNNQQLNEENQNNINITKILLLGKTGVVSQILFLNMTMMFSKGQVQEKAVPKMFKV